LCRAGIDLVLRKAEATVYLIARHQRIPVTCDDLIHKVSFQGRSI